MRTITETKIRSFKGEKTSVSPPTLNPSFESGPVMRTFCPPQIMLTTARITPSSPRVAIIGATPAIGPVELCFTSKRIRIISTNAAKIAPPIIATGSAIQNELSCTIASYPK